MPYYYYGIDIYYIVLIIPALIFALIAQIMVKNRLNSYSRIANSRRMTGEQAAQRMLSQFGITDIAVVCINGDFNDHFDPTANVIRLSTSVYSGTSIASVCVACHEAGHAVQYATSYSPVSLKRVLMPIARIGSVLAIPLILIGFLLPVQYDIVVRIGIILYASCFAMTVITLPIEFNASKRALAYIGQYGLLDTSELKGAKKVLTAAAMTYVASMFSALMNLLRLILIASGRRGGRD